MMAVVLLLFVAGGRQQRAKSLVKDFMEANMSDYDKVSFVDFSSVDSTRVVSDSLIAAMQQQSPSHFRKDVHYQSRNGRALMFIRAKYRMDEDTLSATFYIDKEMTGVVAFKEN